MPADPIFSDSIFSDPMISAIVAMAENRVIGSNNKLPWRLPVDLKRFKAITTGHPVLMGRKTYESIGKPLPNRYNMIITRNQSFHAPNCMIVRSVNEAIQQAIELDNKEIFVIGGAEVYQQLMPHIRRIYLTIIHHPFEGDAYFPELNRNDWKECERVTHQPNGENAYSYSFVILEKIRE